MICILSQTAILMLRFLWINLTLYNIYHIYIWIWYLQNIFALQVGNVCTVHYKKAATIPCHDVIRLVLSIYYICHLSTFLKTKFFYIQGQSVRTSIRTSVRTSVRPYETVRSFSLIWACQNLPIDFKLSAIIPIAVRYLVKGNNFYSNCNLYAV